MPSTAQPKRTKGSHNRERVEPEQFIAELEPLRLRRWAMYLALFLGVVFAAVVILQALGLSHLPPRAFYVIVVSLLGIVTFFIRAAFKQR